MREIDPEQRLPSLADFLGELVSAVAVEPELPVDEELPRELLQQGMHVSELTAEMPFELELIEDQGVWQLDAAPPTQCIETSVLPVWHRLQITVRLEDGDAGLDSLES